MFGMNTSKTFTTPHGLKATTKANKFYALVGEIKRGVVEPEAHVFFRTNNLAAARRRLRREICSERTQYDFIYLFRKVDGARYIGDNARVVDEEWVNPDGAFVD